MMNERAILLVDMQSFYASVEKVEAPHLKDVPLIVSGDPKRRSGSYLRPARSLKNGAYKMHQDYGKHRKNALKPSLYVHVCSVILMFLS